jgi:hypothetical protein
LRAFLLIPFSKILLNGKDYCGSESANLATSPAAAAAAASVSAAICAGSKVMPGTRSSADGSYPPDTGAAGAGASTGAATGASSTGATYSFSPQPTTNKLVIPNTNNERNNIDIKSPFIIR